MSIDPAVEQRDDRRNRAAGAATSSRSISASTTSTSSATRRSTCGSTTRGISCRRRTRSSTRSRRIRSIRGSRARRCSTRRSSSRQSKAHLNPGGVVTLFVQLYESNTGRGEERDRDVPRRVSERHRLGQHERGTRLRSGPARAGRSRRRSTSTRSRRSCSGRSTRRQQSLRADRHALGGRSLLDLRRPQARPRAVAAQRARSTATAICGCSISPVSG